MEGQLGMMTGKVSFHQEAVIQPGPGPWKREDQNQNGKLTRPQGQEGVQRGGCRAGWSLWRLKRLLLLRCSQRGALPRQIV